jgi:hypothetical protein
VDRLAPVADLGQGNGIGPDAGSSVNGHAMAHRILLPAAAVARPVIPTSSTAEDAELAMLRHQLARAQQPRDGWPLPCGLLAVAQPVAARPVPDRVPVDAQLVGDLPKRPRLLGHAISQIRLHARKAELGGPLGEPPLMARRRGKCNTPGAAAVLGGRA